MAEISIANIVGTVLLGKPLDLQAMGLALEESEYEPKHFPGLTYRIPDTRITFILFKSGKMVCTGSHSLQDAREALNTLAGKLAEIGITMDSEPQMEIANIVATANVGSQLDLARIAGSLEPENVEYVPDQFAGLVYQMNDPRVSLTVFDSGKIMCTGARSMADVERSIENMRARL